jgi:hypothetical protein
MSDQIRYDLLTQQALRGVVRAVLTDAAKKGLPGDHHFFIEFDTQAPGVRMSDRLRAQHPEKMTVILQHQFWDLTVTEQNFEVGLSFGGITERLAIPFDAISGFFDPSVKFGLQFEEMAEGLDQIGDKSKDKTPAKGAGKTAPVKRFPGTPASVPSITPPPAAAGLSVVPDPDPDKPTNGGGGGEVVRLDPFRKK